MDVVVIGAGASGIIAALKASYKNRVILLDSNDKCGKKILITGNGNCNYWNEFIDINKYQTDNKELLNNILKKQKEVFNFLSDIGIYPKIKNGLYYPYSNQASSIREIFQREIYKHNIDFKPNFKVVNIIKQGEKFIIESEFEKIVTDKVIIATGSKAYPKTGSMGFGYEIANKFNIRVNEVLPALTRLKSNEPYLKDWENVRCEVKISLFINDEYKTEEIGELHLTKNGISGICVFNISSLVSKNLNNKINVVIDFLPNIDINNIFKNNDKTIEEELESLFHYKLMFVLLKKAGISKDKKFISLTNLEKENLISQLKHFNLPITETDGFETCQVCTGGVSLNEIKENMECKKIPNLYFVGEVLDVDGKCGGFNLAFAFITGYIAGSDLC